MSESKITSKISLLKSVVWKSTHYQRRIGAKQRPLINMNANIGSVLKLYNNLGNESNGSIT